MMPWRDCEEVTPYAVKSYSARSTRTLGDPSRLLLGQVSCAGGRTLIWTYLVTGSGPQYWSLVHSGDGCINASSSDVKIQSATVLDENAVSTALFVKAGCEAYSGV